MRAGRILFWVLAGVSALLGVLMLQGVWQNRLASGDLYPPGSSLRADPLGARLLHDSLEASGAVKVQRHLQRLERLEAGAGDAVLLLGALWGDPVFRSKDLAALDRAWGAGATVIVAFETRVPRPQEPKEDEEAAPDSAGSDQPQESKARDAEPSEPAGEGGAPQHSAAPQEPPPRLLGVWVQAEPQALWPREPALLQAQWKGAPLEKKLSRLSQQHLQFKEPASWEIAYTGNGTPVVAQRRMGRGRLVVLAEDYPLTNEGLARERPYRLLAWALGGARRVVFAEGHLGLSYEPGFGDLARRYGLGPALLLLCLAGGLWIWRQSSRLVPTASEAEADSSPQTEDSVATLARLLRRVVPPAQLVRMLVERYAKGARRMRLPQAVARAKRLEAALSGYRPDAPLPNDPVVQRRRLGEEIRRRT